LISPNVIAAFEDSCEEVQNRAVGGIDEVASGHEPSHVGG
jgi:hypothetical protein